MVPGMVRPAVTYVMHMSVMHVSPMGRHRLYPYMVISHSMPWAVTHVMWPPKNPMLTRNSILTVLMMTFEGF